MYSFRDFLGQFWFPQHLEIVAADASKRIVEIVKGGVTGEQDLDELMQTLPSTEVVSRLQSIPSVKKKDFGALDEQVQKLVVCRNTALTITERFSALCRLNRDAAKYARTQIDQAKKGLGEGHFFISEVVDQSEIGFVVRMRRIYSIPEDQLFKSVAAQRSRSGGSEVTAVRFARLTSLYRFRVLQLFAQQFSRVGLPDDITELGSLAIDHLVSVLVQENE
jgi:hypothetical protein